MEVPSTRLRLRVAPGARRAELVGRHGEAWKVRVGAAPERGRANEAVLRLLGEKLAIPRRQLNLVSGHAARDKVVELAGLDRDKAERRLAAACAERNTQ